MAHAHPHAHGPARHDPRSTTRLAITLALVLVYMVAEVAGGILANSLALLADAGHMLSDAGALALALFALWFARRPAGPQHTYGYYRVEILAALANGATLIAIAVLIFVEAVERLRAPQEVAAPLMMAVAAGGLVINLAGLWTLHGVRGESLNTRGAWLHVLTDTLGSVQALVAGGLILAFGWHWLDPVASVLIGVLVLYSSWSLVRQSVLVLMEGAPGHIDVDHVRDRLAQVPGVRAVHDLHVWTISSGLVALSAHVEAPRPAADVLRALRHDLEADFGIRHTTIEFDPSGPDDHTLQPCK
jgi:cobalt-zinc-cadmium efflux system protein